MILTLFGLSIAIFLSALDQTILNAAIPHIAADLAKNGRDAALSPWMISSYLLTATIATPIAGKFADIFGTKKMLIAATLAFGITSTLCGLAQDMTSIILARAAQGLAGGAMIGLCFVSVGEIFTAEKRGRYQGLLAASFIVAALVGPALGGYMADAQFWRYIFYLNLPLSLLGCLLFASAFPMAKTERPLAKKIIDYQGILLLVAFLTPMMMAADRFAESGLNDTWTIILAIASCVALPLFIHRERTAVEPLMPMSLFADKTIAICLLTVFNSGIALFGSMLTLALVMQEIFGKTGLETGTALVPLMVQVAVFSVIGGFISTKARARKWLVTAALALLIVGTAMIYADLHDLPASLGPSKILMDAAIGGAGLGLMLPVHTIIVQNSASPQMLGVATSMTQFFRSLGGTLGTGFLSAVLIMGNAHGSRFEMAGALSAALGLYLAGLSANFFINFFLPSHRD